jgi:hypothetical protein
MSQNLNSAVRREGWNPPPPEPPAPAPAKKRDFDQETQELYLVFGGRVEDTQGAIFDDLEGMDVRGIFPTYESAFDVWRGAAQATVDDAYMKYVIVRLR